MDPEPSLKLNLQQQAPKATKNNPSPSLLAEAKAKASPFTIHPMIDKAQGLMPQSFIINSPNH